MSLIQYSSVVNPNAKTTLYIEKGTANVVFNPDSHIDYLIIPASKELSVCSLTNSRLKTGNRLYIKTADNPNFHTNMAFFTGYLEYDSFWEGSIDAILEKVKNGGNYILNGSRVANNNRGVNRAPMYICLHIRNVVPCAQKLPLSQASKDISNEAFPAGSNGYRLLSEMNDGTQSNMSANGVKESDYTFVFRPSPSLCILPPTAGARGCTLTRKRKRSTYDLF